MIGEFEIKSGAGSSARAEMRLHAYAPVRVRRWFLRSRGDAPVKAQRSKHKPRVPPLARRCAAVTRRPLVEYFGSSARAEMRLTSSEAHQRGRRFLRSRGDAPAASFPRASRRAVPPLARRCAAQGAACAAYASGSSARAEMRPGVDALGRGVAGFLRSRGDAPRPHDANRDIQLVPPLARRCASRLIEFYIHERGSSARAEMRPRTTAW